MNTDDARRRIGRRGAVLLVLAFVDFVVGWSYVAPTDDVLRAPNTLWREQWAPAGVWGALWFGVGLLCLIAAFTRQDMIGYTAAVGLKLLWATMEATGWIAGQIPLGYRPAIIWAGFAVLIMIVAGLREPNRGAAPPPGEGGTA